MQLIYYAHSYRKPDAGVVEFFGELMRSEGLVPSLDPPSNRLNSAKPERHLGSTDGMVAVLTTREEGVSQYILYEISLCLRSAKPLLVFIEDTLPNSLVPQRVLQRRFSRRGLLREVRNHRHAIRILKTYLGDSPPPRYQPTIDRRSCLLVGESMLPEKTRRVVEELLEERFYTPTRVDSEDGLPIFDQGSLEKVALADLAVCFVDAPDSGSHLVLGLVRAFVTPAILLTTDTGFPVHRSVPREYQPQVVSAGDAPELHSILLEQIEVSEEEYVDLENQDEVSRYAQLLIEESSPSGEYSPDARKVFIRELVQIGDLSMSRDEIHISHVSGVVNVKSQLDHVSQVVDNSTSLTDARKSELNTLLSELRQALEPVAQEHPEDADRVLKSTELVVSEATKEKPSRGFLTVTTEGLKEAAKAVYEIAPTVLAVVQKLVAFVATV